MFELPEVVVLARQINTTLAGKTVQSGSLGNSPHKFVWYNRTPAEFEALVQGKTVGPASTRGRWLFIDLEPGYRLVFGEFGGKFLYHTPGAALPAKYHFAIQFTDGSALSVMTQMWGAMELFVAGEECNRQYIKDMRPAPLEPAFTLEYFSQLVAQEKRSVKGLLTQDQLIPGLGNSIAQDIMFNANLHPRHSVSDLSQGQIKDLYLALVDTVQEVIEQGGRYDETDLFNQPGQYVRQMDKEAVARPCPRCSGPVQKMNYLGGACYFCPHCQR